MPNPSIKCVSNAYLNIPGSLLHNASPLVIVRTTRGKGSAQPVTLTPSAYQHFAFHKAICCITTWTTWLIITVTQCETINLIPSADAPLVKSIHTMLYVAICVTRKKPSLIASCCYVYGGTGLWKTFTAQFAQTTRFGRIRTAGFSGKLASYATGDLRDTLWHLSQKLHWLWSRCEIPKTIDKPVPLPYTKHEADLQVIRTTQHSYIILCEFF